MGEDVGGTKNLDCMERRKSQELFLPGTQEDEG